MCNLVPAKECRSGTLGAGGCVPFSRRCPKSATSSVTRNLVAAIECRLGTLGAGGCAPSSPRSPESVLRVSCFVQRWDHMYTSHGVLQPGRGSTNGLMLT